MGAPCGKPTHSTSAPTHSLCEPSSVQCSPLSHAGTHGASRARSPPPIHPGEGCCSHFFFLFLLSSSPPGIADFVFVFGSLSLGVDDINRAAFFFLLLPLPSAVLRTGEELPEDARITTESSVREFFFLFYFLYFLFFILSYFIFWMGRWSGFKQRK